MHLRLASRSQRVGMRSEGAGEYTERRDSGATWKSVTAVDVDTRNFVGEDLQNRAVQYTQDQNYHEGLLFSVEIFEFLTLGCPLRVRGSRIGHLLNKLGVGMSKDFLRCQGASVFRKDVSVLPRVRLALKP